MFFLTISASNFFACAGYKVIDNIGFDTVNDGIEAALGHKADVVVICSSDEEYVEYAPEAYQKLDGKAIFVVAGLPSCKEDLEKLGIEHFIHIKSNLVETLEKFHQLLGIK